VLALLLERPGQVVTREELKQRLWAGTVVDFDHGLNMTVNRLREALGDAADTPRFIETVPRRGYRFIYPLDGAPRTVRTVWLPTTHRRPDRPGRRRTSENRLARSMAPSMAAHPSPGSPSCPGARGRRPQRPRSARTPDPSIGSQHLFHRGAAAEELSGDAQQDYFAEGMTEALITELGKIGSLQVLSYQSVLAYRQTTKPLPQIAREVKVDAFLVGAVLHSGGRVRVTASLFQASPERQLWAESYESDVRDVLAVQKDLARDVATRIGVKIAHR